MENTRRFKLKLLPTYFKLIGFGLIIIGFAPGPLIKISHLQLQEAKKELIQLFCKALIVLGLAFVAWSKERSEDIGLMNIRIKSFLFAFIVGGVLVVFQPIGDLLLFGKEDHISAVAIVAEILFFYLADFYWEKFMRNRKHKIKAASTE
ncbi:MAG: hypothetical protein ACTHK8_01830 [Ginsengibacter sp.]